MVDMDRVLRLLVRCQETLDEVAEDNRYEFPAYSQEVRDLATDCLAVLRDAGIKN